MIIENPDALKSWLTTKLGPLCDADPAALAKYVFALVKKDKPTTELRDSMVEQLEVFLQRETGAFVELLFNTLQTQSYLPSATNVTSVEVKPVVKVEESPANHTEVNNGVLPVVNNNNKPLARRSESDKEDRVLRRPRHRVSPSPPPRGRSRSRSWDRSRRSRSRERLRRRKSPPRGRRDRRSWSKSPVRNRSRSRTPVRHRRGYRSTSRSPPLHDLIKKVTPNSGGATPTQDSNHGDVDMRLTTTSQSIQSVVSAPNNNEQTSNNIYKRRCRDFDEKGYCMRGDLCPYDHGTDPVVLEDMPLSSLGFPPNQQGGNGAMVPVAPTIPGAVVPSRPPPLVQHPGDMAAMRMPEYSPDAPSMGSRVGWFRPGFRGQPGRGGVRGGMITNRPPPQMYVPPQRELISVPVSDNAVPPDNFTDQDPPDFNNTEVPPPTKKAMHNMQHNMAHNMPHNFDFSRLGPRKNNPANCSLELKKVPRGLNNITHLNNHFSRFGKIVNIQVSYEADPEAAIVTFSSHAEANAAYRSTEAVLNNRFIKVFWHNKKQATNEGKQENVPPPSRMTIRDRLGTAPHSSKVLNLVQPRAVQSVVTVVPNVEPTSQEEPVAEKVIMSGNNLTKTVYIPTALKKQPDPALQENSKALATAAILKSQEILAAKETLKKKQEEKRKEALKLTVNLRKRKQELLEMQLSQQKLLIERLEKGKTVLKATEQKALMTTIKGLQESIEKIRKDLAPQKPAPPPPRKTKEEALKEILDAELDLFTRQQEGRESAELKKRVAELKLEAHSLGLLQPASNTRGRGARGRGAIRGIYRGRGGRGSHAHTSVDHRPTRLLVSGHESDEWKDVLAHFAQFGEISDYTLDSQTPSLDLMFKTRKDAEAALIQGRNFRDRVLTVTWSLGHVVNTVAAVTPRSVQQVQQAHEEMQDDDDDGEPELIYEGDEELEIEEEEDDLEDRSWRR